MTNPFVSFVIPFHGSATLLKRCLASIVAQTDGDFEAIVIDDASPEEASAMVASMDNRFRYVRQNRNKSSFQARMRGISSAVGEYVVAVDADDYVLPELVARIRTATTGSKPDIVVYNLEMDSDGTIMRHWCHHSADSISSREAMKRLIAKRLQWNLCAKAIRRDVCIRAIGRQRISGDVYINVSDDFATFFPILLESERCELIDYVGYRYWQNRQSLCHGLRVMRTQIKAMLQTLRAWRVVVRYILDSRRGLTAFLAASWIVLMILKWEVWEYWLAIRGKEMG